MTKLGAKFVIKNIDWFLLLTCATTIPSSIPQADGLSETKVISIDGVLNSGSSSVLSANDDSNFTSIGSSKHFSSLKYVVSSSILKRFKPRISTGIYWDVRWVDFYI